MLQNQLSDIRFELSDAQDRNAELIQRQQEYEDRSVHLDPDMDLVADDDGNIIGSMEPENEMFKITQKIMDGG